MTASAHNSIPEGSAGRGPAVRRRRAHVAGLGRSERLWGVLFVAPAVLLVVYFVAYPLGTVVYYGLTRWNGLSPAEWVGLHNYRVLMHDLVYQALTD